jgi:SAM-dependent methyltransferase
MAARGMFEFQLNNSIREAEYPWAFHATPLQTGMRSLDIGGSLAGFQFVLAKLGLEVHNCDPGESAHGLGWPVRPATFAKLNARFGTTVTLHNCFLEDARFPDGHFDRVFSISTIEHIPENELPGLVREVARILRPGGRFVATIDLFLDIAPFADPVSNRWGRNIDVAAMIAASGLRLTTGTTSQLHGFPDFHHRRIMAQLPDLHIGRDYPALAQCIVLEKD